MSLSAPLNWHIGLLALGFMDWGFGIYRDYLWVKFFRFVENLYTVCTDKSFSGHSFTYQESISVSTAEIKGATAYEVTGTLVDCVSYGDCWS
uniref:Putative survival protein SurE-like phosphatase/nucleotidase n=1 Tax=Helianthus annuus TaxID=4232 RepID=A0A251SWC9_HELAN